MKSLSSVGLGLSVVFGCLFLALVAEIYYLLWWKRRVTTGREVEDDYYSNPTREFFYIFCWKTKKRPLSWSPTTLSSSQELRTTANSKDLSLKPIDENCVETELIVGPPSFLFTIEEETKEDLDLESDDNSKSRLSDVMNNGDSTPYVTPLCSPVFFTPPLTPSGYNPFYESCTDVEFRKTRSSPPPKFKFLRDAEEKLQKKNTMEEVKGGSSSTKTRNAKMQTSEEDGSLITIIVANDKQH